MPTKADLFPLAWQHHKAGNLHHAEMLYNEVLQDNPENADAHNLLGVLCYQTGRLDQAVVSLCRALALNPKAANYHCNLGLAQDALGLKQAAEAAFRLALVLRPDYPEAHHNLANVLASEDHQQEAIHHYEQAVRIRPEYPETRFNLGNALQDQGMLHEAVTHWQVALRVKHDYPEVHNNLGNALWTLGQFEQAAWHCQQALLVRPAFAEAHNNLGNALHSMGRLEEAAAHYQQTLSIRPDFAEAHLHLGNVMLEQHKSKEAAAHYREAIRIKPDMADAHAALGHLLHDQEGDLDGAVASLQQAVRLQPAPRFRIDSATIVPVVCQSMAELESWRTRLIREVRLLRDEQVVQDVTNEPRSVLFYLAYQGLNDRYIQRDVANLYSRPSPLVPRPSPGIPDASPVAAQKIRVGFLSSFFRQHTIGLLNAGLIKNLSRSSFEVTVLSIGRQDDDLARFIEESADRYVELPRHLPTARGVIVDRQLDVLYYTDIGMDPITSTLAFSRLAPVQCATWGHPVTTGIEAIDYFISSEALDTDDADHHYTEKLIRLKTLPIYYYRPQLPAAVKTRADFALPAGAHIYACPQSLFKFYPQFDEILGDILRGDPQGILVLGWPQFPRWEQLLRQRFASTLPDVLDRIRFLPKLSRPDFLSFMVLAEVLLDTLHFGGGNTSFEGLALGVPIVTLPSQFLRGRITFALYQQMQMLDCVARSPREYVDIALRIGKNADYREMIKSTILAANAVLFENSEGVRELEQFFQRAVDNARQVEMP